MIITEAHYLLFSSTWRLRIEGGHGVLYSRDPEYLVWYILKREWVVALLLMDGQKKLSEIRTILHFLFSDNPHVDPKQILELLFSFSSSSQNPNHFIEAAPVPFSVSVTYTMQSAIEELSRYTTDQYNRLASGLPLYPLNLTILPENQCVTDCVYCYAERKPLKKEELLSFDRWKELIFEAHALGISLAVLSGGDPLTYSQIIPLLKCLLEHDFYFVLPSKLFISKSLAKTMADIGMSRAWNQVSIDAYTDATAFKMVGVHNYATRTFSSIVNMVEVGLQVRANCVLTPVNFREVVGLVKKLDSLGVKKISIAAYGRSHYRHNDNFFLSEEQMEWVNRNVGALKSTLRCADISCNLAQRDYSKNRDTAIPTKWDGRAKCSGGRSSIVITPTGKVTLCEQMPVEDEYIAGDLKQQSLLELWNSDRLNRMIYPDKAKFLGTVCEACQDFEVCVYEYGYCFRDALFSFGTIYAPPPNCPKAPQGIRMQ